MALAPWKTTLLASPGSRVGFSGPPPPPLPRMLAMRLMISGSVSVIFPGLARACASCRLRDDTSFLRSFTSRLHATTLSLASLSRRRVSSSGPRLQLETTARPSRSREALTQAVRMRIPFFKLALRALQLAAHYRSKRSLRSGRRGRRVRLTPEQGPLQVGAQGIDRARLVGEIEEDGPVARTPQLEQHLGRGHHGLGPLEQRRVGAVLEEVIG